MVMDYKSLITDYEMILKCPEMDSVSHWYFKKSHQAANSTIALVKYAIEEILLWTPEEAVMKLTPDILIKLKLGDLSKTGSAAGPIGYIKFLPGLNINRKIQYIVHKCYPKEISFNKRDCITEIYDKVLKAKKKGESEQYPKDFFKYGDDGFLAGVTCLRRGLSTEIINPASTSAEELYVTFADKKAASNILKKLHLTIACKNLFDSEPLDFLHNSLSESQRNETLYQYYKFMKFYDAAYKQTDFKALRAKEQSEKAAKTKKN